MSELKGFGEYLISSRQMNECDLSVWEEAQEKPERMARLLRKYSRELVEKFGMEIKEIFDKFSDKPMCKPVAQKETGDILFKVTKLPKGNFDEFVKIQKSHNFWWNKTEQCWFLSKYKRKEFDYPRYCLEMYHIGYSVCALPVFKVVEQKRSVPQRLYKEVFVTRHANGKFDIRFSYSEKLNELFSNQTGKLSGITEYNPNNHARETYSIELVLEALDKIKAIHPDWKISTPGLEDAIREHEEFKERLEIQIPEVREYLAEDYALFPFQNEGVLFFEKTNGNALLADAVGAGKTLQTLSWIVMRRKRCLIVCPKVVRKTWINEARKFFPNYFKDTVELISSQIKKHGLPDLLQAQLATVNYESLHKFFPSIESSGFEVLVIDECFHKDTHVETPYGSKKISEIIPGDKVLNCTGEDIVLNVSRKKIDGFVCLVFGGVSIKCSLNHPFFTLRGWVHAKELKEGDYLVTTEKSVRLLQKNLLQRYLSKHRALISILLGELRHEKKDSRTRIPKIYSRKKSNVQKVYSGEGFKNIEKNEMGASSERRKWFWSNGSREKNNESLQNHKVELCNFFRRKASWLSDLLQSRFSFSGIKISNRSGWSISLFEKETRLKEREETEFIRMDSVEIQERGMFESEEESYFYDIEVQKHPSFSVNGALVHNSQKIKGINTANCQNVYKIAPLFPHKILLSATAIKNKKHELFPQINLIKPGLFEGEHDLKLSTIGSAWNKIQDVYLRRNTEDVVKDFPDLITQIIEIDATGLPDYDPAQGLSIDMIARLKADVAKGKAKITIDFIRELLNSIDNDTSGILVFSDSIEAAKEIQSSLGEDIAMLHHGEMTHDKREKLKHDFQEGRTSQRVFVTTRQSLAVGATLTRADRVVFNDLPWNAADTQQATGRAHRIGSKNTVYSYWITAGNNHFDKKITAIIKKKYDLCKKMNEGKQLTQEEREWMNTPVKIEELKEK